MVEGLPWFKVSERNAAWRSKFLLEPALAAMSKMRTQTKLDQLERPNGGTSEWQLQQISMVEPSNEEAYKIRTCYKRRQCEILKSGTAQCSFISVFGIFHSIYPADEAHEITCVVHLLRSWGPPQTNWRHLLFFYSDYRRNSSQFLKCQTSIGNGWWEQFP